MATKTILTTRRLRLRTWRRSDWREYAVHCNTDEVMFYLGGVMTERQVRREVEWHIKHQLRHGFSFWVIERKSDGALLGFCGLIRVSETASPIRGQLEIGWRIRADMWRRGYALEAASAVLTWIASRLAGQPVYARINVLNEASAMVAQKVGLRRIDGGEHTHPLDGMKLALFATTLGRSRRKLC